MGIIPADIVLNGPYRQTATTTQTGCQIDYLIENATNNLFVCEFKLSRRELGVDIMSEMQTKINALKVPRRLAPVPVLFHLSGVSHKVSTAHYFYRIIDIASFLEE